MAQCLSSVVLLWISLGTVLGAGFLGVRPQSNGDCRYDDINKAHFSYDQNHCEGKSFLWFFITNLIFHLDQTITKSKISDTVSYIKI